MMIRLLTQISANLGKSFFFIADKIIFKPFRVEISGYYSDCLQASNTFGINIA
jgi:hypothetical protein